ncbi:MAG: hypothetical protein ABEJ82_03605 [Haloplanus sp.]
MRVPVPTNRLVALALVGALLTTVVSVGLLSPDLFPGSNAIDAGDDAPTPGAPAADAPTPNANFTPAVQTASNAGRGEHEDGEYEEGEHEEGEHEEDAHEGGERE